MSVTSAVSRTATVQGNPQRLRRNVGRDFPRLPAPRSRRHPVRAEARSTFAGETRGSDEAGESGRRSVGEQCPLRAQDFAACEGRVPVLRHDLS